MSRTKKPGGTPNPTAFFPTDPRLTTALLHSRFFPSHLRYADWLEPCAGDGAIMRAARDYFIMGPRWHLNEIDPTHQPKLAALSPLSLRIGDALTLPERPTPWKLTITNPPFFLSEQIFKKFRASSEWLILLLRVGFLEAISRRPILENDQPMQLTLSPRPGFSGDGKRDATAYAWMIWGPERRRIAPASILYWKEAT